MFTWNGLMQVDLSSSNKQDPLQLQRGFFYLKIFPKIFVFIDMNEMMIKLLKKEFGKHFWNQIKMINSYKELPKEFRNPRVFGPGFWDHYSKLGQFFYVSVPPKKYLILLPSGIKNPLGEDEPLRVSDEIGRVINPYEVEGQLRIAYMGLKLEDLLRYYMDERVSKFKKIDESDMNRLVKKILKEQQK